jgi:poly(A) polymerase
VLPEIEPQRQRDLEALIGAEQAAAIEPDGLRRLAALLPRNPDVAGAVGARLKLSNKARARLKCAAVADLDIGPQALAYRIGSDCAVDRMLLAGNAEGARATASWIPPRLPVRGGALIARGLPEGPLVARTLRQIEDEWVRAGFPTGDALEEIVSRALAAA